MSYAIIHAIGSSICFVLFLLLLWAGQLPRTRPGPGWWALGMLAASISRIAFALLLEPAGMPTASSVYTALIVVEKASLVVGLIRFLERPQRLHWLLLAALACWLWVLLAWWLRLPQLQRGLGGALYSAGMLGYAAWLLRTRSPALASVWARLLRWATVLAALHWLLAYPLIEWVPGWQQHAFLLGSALFLAQYFALLALLLQDVQQRLVDAEARALDLAFKDALTGLNNKHYMNTLFENALLLANRPHQIAAVLFIDLDNFKPINDQAGHKIGDEVLRQAAQRLRLATRSTDICARLGGDEFVVICTQLERREQVCAIAEKLLQAFVPPFEVAGGTYRVGASIGISLYPQHGETLQVLLEQADQAMYRVKSGRKNSFCMFGEVAC